MAHDISQRDNRVWAARTAGGMVCVHVAAAEIRNSSVAELVTLRNDTGDVIPARLIGPVAGGLTDDTSWRIDVRYRVDQAGEPLSTLVTRASPSVDGTLGHDWGALGLPDGLESRVRPASQPSRADETTRALASSGHRLGQTTWWLVLAPGDRVTVDGNPGTVLAIDRRKRTVDVEIDGETRTVPLADARCEPV